MGITDKLNERRFKVLKFLKENKGYHSTGKISSLLGINYYLVENALDRLLELKEVKREGLNNGWSI